jgi:hypothetical protein
VRAEKRKITKALSILVRVSELIIKKVITIKIINNTRKTATNIAIEDSGSAFCQKYFLGNEWRFKFITKV